MKYILIVALAATLVSCGGYKSGMDIAFYSQPLSPVVASSVTPPPTPQVKVVPSPIVIPVPQDAPVKATIQGQNAAIEVK